MIGLIDPNKTITMKELVDSGCVGKLRDHDQGVKLLSEVLIFECKKKLLSIKDSI